MAEEIRKLAEQSTNSVHEINAMLQSLQEKSQNAVDIMQGILTIIKEQVESVQVTESKFHSISGEVEDVKTIVNRSMASAKKMDKQKTELSDIMQSLAAIAEENAASSEEAAASVEEQTASMEEIHNASITLARLAEELQEGITKFKY